MLHKFKYSVVEQLFKEEEHPDASVTYTQAYYDFQYYCFHLMCVLSEKTEGDGCFIYDIEAVAENMEGILKSVCLMLHLHDLECPELEYIEDFIGENVPVEKEEDPILALCALQISFLDNFTLYFLEKGGSVDKDEIHENTLIENRDHILSSCCTILENTGVHPLEFFESEEFILECANDDD